MGLLDALADRRFSGAEDGTPLFVLSVDGWWVVRLTEREAARLRAIWKAVTVGCLLAFTIGLYVVLIYRGRWGFFVMTLLLVAGLFALQRLVALGKPVQCATDGTRHAPRGKFSRSLGRRRVLAMIATSAALGGACMIAWIFTEPWATRDPDAWRTGGSLAAVYGWAVSWLAGLWLSWDLGFAGECRHAASGPRGPGKARAPR